MYNSAVFLLLNSKFHNFQLNVIIHWCLRKIFLFFWGGWDGNKFYAIFTHILILNIYIVIGHLIVFLRCDPLACNREVFSGFDHEIPENVFLFDRMWVSSFRCTSHGYQAYQTSFHSKKFRDISLKISILNFFHLLSFPSFSCKRLSFLSPSTTQKT